MIGSLFVKGGVFMKLNKDVYSVCFFVLQHLVALKLLQMVYAFFDTSTHRSDMKVIPLVSS